MVILGETAAAVGWTKLEGEAAGLANGVDAGREGKGRDTRDLVLPPWEPG